MKYIWCEDTGSGFFFWQQINNAFFDGKYIVKCSNGIDDLVKDIASVQNNENQYLVCFDNCTDNHAVASRVSALRKLERTSKNITLVQYICFEQVILSSTEILRFLPNIANDVRYSIVKQHVANDYTDVNQLLNLCKLANIPSIQYKTSERFFRPILEDNAIVSSNRITVFKNNKPIPFDKTVMHHHYIYKGSWSRCWSTDCTPNCPAEYCWKTQYDCINCKNPIKNSTCIQSETYDNSGRKYEEAMQCDRDAQCIPKKQKERIKMLFGNSILKSMLPI